MLLPAKSVAPAKAAPGAGNQGTVLVVDDDKGVQLLVRRALTSHGYGVILASSREDALRLFERHGDELCLILMDVTMPQMSGIEALKRIRANGSNIAVISSSGCVVEMVAADPPMFSAYLQRPYDLLQLLGAVASAIISGAHSA